MASLVVTAFQPIRPWLMMSSVLNWRARLYGSLKVVDPVATNPMRSVARAAAAIVSRGSRVSIGASWVRSLVRPAKSGRKKNCTLPRSAAWA